MSVRLQSSYVCDLENPAHAISLEITKDLIKNQYTGQDPLALPSTIKAARKHRPPLDLQSGGEVPNTGRGS